MERHGVTVALWLCQPASERPGPLASHWQAQVPGTPGGPGHVPVVSDSRNSLSVFPAEFCPARAGTDVTAQNRVKSCGNHPPFNNSCCESVRLASEKKRDLFFLCSPNFSEWICEADRLHVPKSYALPEAKAADCQRGELTSL